MTALDPNPRPAATTRIDNVDGVNVLMPAKYPIAVEDSVMPFGNGEGRIITTIKKITYNDGTVLYGCVDCEYVHEKFASVFSHRGKHTLAARKKTTVASARSTEAQAELIAALAAEVAKLKAAVEAPATRARPGLHPVTRPAGKIVPVVPESAVGTGAPAVKLVGGGGRTTVPIQSGDTLEDLVRKIKNRDLTIARRSRQVADLKAEIGDLKQELAALRPLREALEGLIK